MKTMTNISSLLWIFLSLFHQSTLTMSFHINPTIRRSSTIKISRSMSPNENGSKTDSQQQQQPSITSPTSFREAEILGLRYMQQGLYEDALKVFEKGLQLPGSKVDIVRTKTLSGPSPVGGASGGTEGKTIKSLDEFELQAAYYNIACVYAKLGNVSMSVENLEKAFQSGFDNYATVRADPDLSSVVQGTKEFEDLMNQYDPRGSRKRGFPFF